MPIRSPVAADLQSALNQIAAQIEAGELVGDAASAALRGLLAPASPPARGRPRGRKSFHETPAMKRAKQYFELLGAGKKSTAAARKVAIQWQVAECTVFQDARRHGGRIADDMERSAINMKREVRLRLIALGRKFKADYPERADQFLAMWSQGFLATAEKLESLGNPTNAAYVRDYAKAFEESDIYLEFLANVYRLILRTAYATNAGG
jgi:hypothetical protein